LPQAEDYRFTDSDVMQIRKHMMWRYFCLRALPKLETREGRYGEAAAFGIILLIVDDYYMKCFLTYISFPNIVIMIDNERHHAFNHQYSNNFRQDNLKF